MLFKNEIYYFFLFFLIKFKKPKIDKFCQNDRSLESLSSQSCPIISQPARN